MQINKLLNSDNIDNIIMAIMLLHLEIPFECCKEDGSFYVFKRPVEIPEPGKPVSAYTYMKIYIRIPSHCKTVNTVYVDFINIKLSDRPVKTLTNCTKTDVKKMEQLIQDLKNSSNIKKDDISS